MESILPRVLYVLQDAGVARRWRLALRVAVCFARRRRLAAVAVLLQREVAELWEALSVVVLVLVIAAAIYTGVRYPIIRMPQIMPQKRAPASPAS